jgi:hypothetical protein
MRYKDIIDSAEWIERDPQQRPLRLKQGTNLIYFIYGSHPLPWQLKRKTQQFVKTHPQEVYDGVHYRFNGLIRKCTFQSCQLVYLEQQP